MKKILIIIVAFTLTGCDKGWQKQNEDKDKKIIILTKENYKLKRSYDSLYINHMKYTQQQIYIMNQMIAIYYKLTSQTATK